MDGAVAAVGTGFWSVFFFREAGKAVWPKIEKFWPISVEFGYLREFFRF